MLLSVSQGLSLLPVDLGSGAQWQARGVVRECGDSRPVSPGAWPPHNSCQVTPPAGPRGAVSGPAVTPPALHTLCAPQEEMAELKAQLYLLEKEKKALELKLSTREAQEQAYLVHIEHLKSEVEEQKEQRTRSLSSTSSGGKDAAGKVGRPGLSLPSCRATLTALSFLISRGTAAILEI